jgi:F0F1-type ATP synthase assembly protein I
MFKYFKFLIQTKVLEMYTQKDKKERSKESKEDAGYGYQLSYELVGLLLVGP